MTTPAPDMSLEEIRRDIDAIDDAMLDLMIRRLGATEQVRNRKRNDGSLSASPFRPAREAQMLRRLIGHGKGKIDPQLVVRLWRVILSSSIREQAPVTLHVEKAMSQDLKIRMELEQHFCGLMVESHRDVADAISALSANRGDLAIVRTESGWADALPRETGIIGTLPVLKSCAMPHLLILGHVEPAPSGDDETILLSSAPLPIGEGQAPRWQIRSGSCHVTCLPGFHTAGSLPPSQVSNLNLRVAGRYPASIEVSP